MDIAFLVEHGVKLKECEMRDKYVDFGWELEKLLKMKVTIIPIVFGALGLKTGRIRNNGTGGDSPNCSIVEIGQNTKKSPGVAQTPVKNYQPTLM